MGRGKQGGQGRNTVKIAVIGGLIVVLVLVLTTLWTGRSAQRSTEQAVHSVSNFYLQELAGRREQVVASNLQTNVGRMSDAIDLLDRPDARTVPIIALTANAFDEDVQRSLQAGMNAHLSKPVDPEHLFETLEILIQE